ncbi:MAG: hypothetical protein IJW52_03265 [Clostridia bacterium]|nr:hypothetical protein [Clostridia bacterium]
MNNDFTRDAFVLVTDYVKANTGEDVSDALQELILNNPRRVLYFPDGEYLLSKPICTPANPEHAVSLQLSNFAVIKAMDCWDSDEALIRLGAAEPFNTIMVNGSNYYLSGGIIDGNNVANGVSIDSGRETRVENVSIKHTKVGLHVKWGANSGSADCDICNVNIVGRGTVDSIGLLIEGMDNTFTNMRIARVQIGVKLLKGGNYLRNIHPLYSLASGWDHYTDSIAFCDLSWENWYDFCYSDQYCTGFYFADNVRSICHNCFCFWWKTLEGGEIGFKAGGKFNSLLSNCKVTLRGDAKDTNFLVGAEGGYGVIENPFFNEDQAPDKCYQNDLVGKVLHP